MFTFLYLKANSMEICEEMFFPFFHKNADVSILMRLRANYLEKMRDYPSFSLRIPIALAKIYFFHMVLPWRKNRSPPTNVSRVPFPDPVLLVLYSAPRGLSPATPVFPSSQKPHFQIPIRFWNEKTLVLRG